MCPVLAYKVLCSWGWIWMLDLHACAFKVLGLCSYTSKVGLEDAGHVNMSSIWEIFLAHFFFLTTLNYLLRKKQEEVTSDCSYRCFLCTFRQEIISLDPLSMRKDHKRNPIVNYQMIITIIHKPATVLVLFLITEG